MKETRKIEELHGWDLNPRTITKDGLERLKRQILKLKQYKGLLILEDGTVIGGNMRLKALQDLGIKEAKVNTIKIVEKDGKFYGDINGDISEPFNSLDELKIEYALSDNDRVGKYEGDQLADLIGNFPDVEWNDYAVDIKEPQLVSDIMDQYSEVVEDEVPEVPKVAESKLGEVYTLGRHRLMCGDATKIEDVTKLMDGKKANVLITDPPYGVDYASKNDFLNSMDKGNRNQKAIENDAITDYKQFYTDFLINLKGLFDNSFYIFISGKEISSLIEAIKNCDYHYAQEIVWVKNNHVLGRMDYAPKHENIVYGWQNTHKFFGGFQTSVINFNKPLVSDLHPTMKPIGLIAKIIKDSSLENNIVLDVFGGSGSTLIACEQTNRTCYMMELDPLYCDVIRKRYKNFTENSEKTVK